MHYTRVALMCTHKCYYKIEHHIKHAATKVKMHYTIQFYCRNLSMLARPFPPRSGRQNYRIKAK